MNIKIPILILSLVFWSLNLGIIEAQVLPKPYGIIVPQNATNIQWYGDTDPTNPGGFDLIPGETSDTLYVANPGIYFAEFILNDCRNATDYFIFVHTTHPFLFPLTLNAVAGADSYQWYDGNDLLGGEDANAVEITEIGEYYVLIEDDLCRTESPRFFIVNPNPPIAVDDEFTTEPNQPISESVIPNDETDDISFTVNLISPPPGSETSGTIELLPDGSFTYTPLSDFIGTDTFYYELCNSLGLCDSAKVIIRIDIDCNNFDIKKILIPQLLTPNGDEKNDTWIINDLLKYKDCYNESEVIVFNIWENPVFQSHNYGLDGKWWGGYSTNNLDFIDSDLLPSGTYFYIIYLDGDKDNALSGFIHIQWGR